MPLSLIELEQGKHRLAPSDQVLLQTGEFDSRFVRPRTRVQLALNKLQGRCGDLIVCQLRGSSHAPKYQQATLRSLGLGARYDASLRWSDDDVSAGYLHAVRHLVGIVKLSQPCYKEWLSPYYETQQYGTQTRPGQVWRALTGEYLGYSADNNGVALYMSTTHHFADVLPGIQLDQIGMEPDGSSPNSWVALQNESSEWATRHGHFADVMNGVDINQVRRASIPIKSIGRVGLETVAMTLTWDADVQKFHDIERVSHELGLISTRTYAGFLSGFRDVFSEIGDRGEVPVSMSISGKRGRINVIV